MLTAGEIAAALGGADPQRRRLAGGCCCCHEDRTPSLSLRDGDNGKLLLKCFAGCEARDILAELRQCGLPRRCMTLASPSVASNRGRHQNPHARDHGDLVPRLWRESVDPRGSLAEKYLRGRGLELDDDLCGRVLRFHGHCPFGKDDADKAVYVPALIVAFRPIRDDDETRPPAAIHRIGLKPDGSKIGKMMLGPVGGCAVKLDADEHVEQGLGVCEGIETGLAIRATGWRPIWALGSAGAIKTFAPIPGIEALTIFADHDPTPGSRRRVNVRSAGRMLAARSSFICAPPAERILPMLSPEQKLAAMGIVTEFAKPKGRGQPDAVGEDALALAFADRHDGFFVFDHTRGDWFRWDNAIWRRDADQYAFDCVRALPRTQARSDWHSRRRRARRAHRSSAGARSHCLECQPVSTRHAVGRDRPAHWRASAGRCQFHDQHGDRRAGCSARYAAPIWDRFLAEAAGNDAELVRYLQQRAGYWLTGDTSREDFDFVFGPGGAGKGTFLRTISTVMGGYALNAPIAQFMASKNEGHLCELARLAHARLVIASEPEENRTWAIGKRSRC